MENHFNYIFALVLVGDHLEIMGRFEKLLKRALGHKNP